MLLLLQIGLGFAFLGYLILAFCDAIRGTFTILTGLVLIVIGYTMKLVTFILKRIHPAQLTGPKARTWKIIRA